MREFEGGVVIVNPTDTESVIEFSTLHMNASTGIEGSRFVVAPKDGGIFLRGME